MSVKLYDLTLIDKVALEMCYDICRCGIVAAKSEVLTFIGSPFDIFYLCLYNR